MGCRATTFTEEEEAAQVPELRRRLRRRRCYPQRYLFFFFLFFFYPPVDGEKSSFSSPHFHVFSYASCVDLTQLLSQPNASWRTLRIPS